MKLYILSPEHSIYTGEVDSVTLPGEIGLFTVLKNHAPLISALKEGIITFHESNEEKKDDEKTVKVKGGFVEVKENVLSVCAE